MTAALAQSLTNSVQLGNVEPRIWTPPLRPLTPETSYGFEVIAFARDILERPLDPWQEWLVVHAGELLPDGRPRFRQVLTLVARQNGKTELLVILSLYWLFVERVGLVLGTSTNLDYARESWDKAVSLAESTVILNDEIPPKNGIRRANGEQTLATVWKGRYKIAASNRKGGRSLTIDRLIMDELREHHDWTAYSAAVPATNAVRDAQIWMITNAGDDKSVVLNSIRDQAIAEIDSAGRIGIFEWSAPDGSEPDDIEALASANPNLGHRIDIDSIMGEARRAKQAGGEQLATFLTEVQCRHVAMLDPAIDEDSWNACFEEGSLDDYRDRIALCMDISLDNQHAAIYAAAVVKGGKVRVDPVVAWSGSTCTNDLRRELPHWIERIQPKIVGWFPAGPAAVLAADMQERKGWPPSGVKFEAIRGDITAVCMGFSEQVKSQQVLHSGDPLLNTHVAAAEKLYHGDGWRFTRRGAGHVNAAYAAAGAVHLARTMPTPRARPKVFVGRVVE